MKFSYTFSNLLGTVYKKGNVLFTPDGNILLSPVGNKISAFDLKSNKAETLPIESPFNIITLAIAPNGNLMLLVNEEGEGYLCSLVNKSIISKYHFSEPVHQVKFSPDGTKFAVTKGNKILIFQSPGYSKRYNPFQLLRTLYGCHDEAVTIDWSSDSKVLCVGSKDMNTHIYAAEKVKGLVIYSMGGHRNVISGSFFLKNSLDMVSVSEDGFAKLWTCDTDLRDLKTPTDDSDEESSDDFKLIWKKENHFCLKDSIPKPSKKSGTHGGRDFISITACSFHKRTNVLVTGFNNGTFLLHELPSFSHIQALSVGDQAINSLAFNDTGDWITLACSKTGQLVVWEWQSETYIMKQQGHFNAMNCVTYSPDGQFVATGGEDFKVKVWNTTSGFCFVTFTEHSGSITGVTFTQNGKVIISCSLDGTVRAFDLHRYRNFRTFTSPRQTQFSCVCVDKSGELVCAAGRDVFDVFVWSVQTGKLLEILAGHEAPVASLSFCPINAVLCSASWDKTVKIWNVFENKGSRESIQLNSDVMAVAYRPDGKQIAVATLRGYIHFYNPDTVSQTGSIEAHADIGYVRKSTDKITGKKASANNAFSCICYSADGKVLLCGGQSPYVCIYSISDQALIKRFKITQNLSLDGVQEFLDKRRMGEAGNLDNMEVVDDAQPGLPGVKRGDLSLRKDRPEVRVSSVSFSPTGRAWSATTTEGVLIYSLDTAITFDPFEFGMEVKPETLARAIDKRDYSTSLLMSLRLNQKELIEMALETVPVDQIAVIIQNIPDRYIDRLIERLAQIIESSTHVQFYTRWSLEILTLHGPKLKRRSQSIMSACTSLQKSLTTKHDQLRKICDYNKYTMSYIIATKHLRKRAVQTNDTSPNSEPEDSMTDSPEDNFLQSIDDSLSDSSADIEAMQV